MLPLLSNTRNHDNWPNVVSQDVLRHVHQLKNNVFVIAGQVKGRTLLPLPVGADAIGTDDNNGNNNNTNGRYAVVWKLAFSFGPFINRE